MLYDPDITGRIGTVESRYSLFISNIGKDYFDKSNIFLSVNQKMFTAPSATFSAGAFKKYVEESNGMPAVLVPSLRRFRASATIQVNSHDGTGFLRSPRFGGKEYLVERDIVPWLLTVSEIS
jgi:hypothetical protein